MTDPVEFLRAAHARMERIINALPSGPWQWVHYSDPEWCSSLEGPAGLPEAVLRSTAKGGAPSRLEFHRAFDAFLPDPAAVLRRITAERKILAECQQVLAVDGWEYDDAPQLAEATIRALAEAWGWEEQR